MLRHLPGQRALRYTQKALLEAGFDELSLLLEEGFEGEIRCPFVSPEAVCQDLREREREREGGRECVCERECLSPPRPYAKTCVRERERGRERVCVCESVCLFRGRMPRPVCEREREREGERECV